MPENLVIPIRGEKLSMNVEATERLYHAITDFQVIEIFDTVAFGRILTLDGHIQLTELDEHAYHEALVQIPLLSLDSPRSALVVGGGDGGVIREICRSTSIEWIDMVEIDRGVVDASRQHLPFLGDAFDDPRVHLHIEDAFPFVKRADRNYDLIVVDSTDTYEGEDGNLSEQLFTAEFYGDCRNRLASAGVLVTQADNLVFCPYSLANIRAMFEQVFEVTGSYQALVPSFGGYSGYCWASRGHRLKASSSEVDWSETSFRYLNPVTYDLAFRDLSFGPIQTA